MSVTYFAYLAGTQVNMGSSMFGVESIPRLPGTLILTLTVPDTVQCRLYQVKYHHTVTGSFAFHNSDKR